LHNNLLSPQHDGPDQISATFNPGRLKPEWRHPLLAHSIARQGRVPRVALLQMAYDYYLRFLPFFTDQIEGSLLSGVALDLTKKLKHKLGVAHMFLHKISLNEAYFADDPRLLPYTLFHEMTHLWLYNCLLDPGHTRRFQRKMREFIRTKLPFDQSVHVHTATVAEASFIYLCPNCQNRWHLLEKMQTRFYCGLCHKNEGVQYFPALCSKKALIKAQRP
jgi:predicted SprT family Zn-dependent metalloprotease